MKKWLLLLICFTVLAAGCTSEPAPEPKPNVTPNSTHLSAQQDGLIVEVSNELRTFPENMIPTQEGYDIVGLSVTVTNKTQDNMPIAPDYITLVSVDNTEYKYSEITPTVTGKGAFKTVTLPPEYRGGGLLLFEIKKDVKINSIKYVDESNHDITIKFNSGETTGV